MEPLPESILRDVFTSVLSVRDAGRVAICCRRLRNVPTDVLVSGRPRSWNQLREWMGTNPETAPIMAQHGSLIQLHNFVDRDPARPADVARGVAAVLERLRSGMRIRFGKFVSTPFGAIVPWIGDEDENVRMRVVDLLSYSRDENLRTHASAILAHLQHGTAAVRGAAMAVLDRFSRATRPVLGTLAGLGSEALAARSGELEAALDHSDKYVRVAAFHLLAGVGRTTLASYTLGIAARLDYPVAELRCDALETLTVLEPALADLAGLVAAKLEDPDRMVRYNAVRTLGRLPRPMLTQYVGSVVARLGDDVDHVAREAHRFLVDLSPTDLVEHASDIMAMLEHGHADYALSVVRLLPPPSIAEHATAIAAKLRDPDERVRATALQALAMLDRVPRQAHVQAFIGALADSDEEVVVIASECLESSLEGLEMSALAQVRERISELEYLIDKYEVRRFHRIIDGLGLGVYSYDDVACQVCGSGDDAATMLLCDGCETGAAHMSCLGLSKVPDGDWFCPACGGAPYDDLVCRPRPRAVGL